MAEKETLRYLLGGGEKLSTEIGRPGRGMGEKSHPYTFSESVDRLQPQWSGVDTGLAQLPSAALPDGEAVIGLTLHPSYLAKSYYPQALLRELGLRHMGSRAVHLRPDTVATKKAINDGRSQLAPLLYVAGNAERIRKFSSHMKRWVPSDERIKEDFRKIEEVSLPKADRFKRFTPSKKNGTVPLEIVLHVDEKEDERILAGFLKFALDLDVEVITNRRRTNGGLCFLPARALFSEIPRLLDFTFLRAVREMPSLKAFEPMMRSDLGAFSVKLPEEDAVAPDLAVAIFDGGLPAKHGLDRWVTLRDAPKVGAPVSGADRHGMGVTSAFLFGPLEEGKAPVRPYANVDHWRVVGADTKADDFEILSVLDRIEDVVSSRHYDFINISLGPNLAMDDDDVNAWTSTMDSLLADGETVATIACGNNGALDARLGLHRVQPPSDGVNAISVGASDRMLGAWIRAPYSAQGPGRSPGFVKPDFLTFGGSVAHPFLMLDGSKIGAASGNIGTSFASPLAMRCAAGVRAQFRQSLWAPTVKALLIHQANPLAHARSEVGWGRLSHGLGDLVLCGDGEAHVLYQRQMPLTGSVRMEIPVPPEIKGLIEIKATFCIYSDIDPADSLNYTRAGLDIQFRPDSVTLPAPYVKNGKVVTPSVPASSSFFNSADLYPIEFIRREDAHKWETSFTKARRLQSTSLNRPVFDITYSPRSHGQGSKRSSNLKLALVLTIRHKKTIDLYDRVVALAAGRLQPLRERVGVSIPVRLQA